MGSVVPAAMSSLDPEQVGVLSNAGGVLLQADEAGQAGVTVVLRSLQDLERLVKEASAKDVRDGYALSRPAYSSSLRTQSDLQLDLQPGNGSVGACQYVVRTKFPVLSCPAALVSTSHKYKVSRGNRIPKTVSDITQVQGFKQ